MVRPTLPAFSVAPTTATFWGFKIASSSLRSSLTVKVVSGSVAILSLLRLLRLLDYETLILTQDKQIGRIYHR
jgi:hypothetical protein